MAPGLASKSQELRGTDQGGSRGLDVTSTREHALDSLRGDFFSVRTSLLVRSAGGKELRESPTAAWS
jgi:hypothetical protein